MAKTCLSVVLWLFLGSAALAGAEGALFAPPEPGVEQPDQPRPKQPKAEPPKVSVPDPRAAGRITASSGLFSPGMTVDARGHKTLVIRGEEEEEKESGIRSETLAPTVRQTLVVHGNQDTEEKPYWVVEARLAERPYFRAEEKTPDTPYWLEREELDDTPYWLAEESTPERPYWEPPPERVEIIAHTVEPTVTAPPPAPEPAGGLRTISYFMYQDEFGIKHLSNVPDDPRYREFTVTVRLGRGLAGARTGQLRFTHESLRPVILRAAAAYNLDPALIAAVIKSESAFDANAVSWAGAQGLMQLMPTTAREMGCADPFDPVQNIMAGSRYLRRMLDTFGGDLTLAIASYNCGPERVKRLWRVPNISETKNYVTIVSRNYEHYKGQF